MPGLILALPANARFMSVKNIDTKTSITKGYKAVYYIFISATSVCYYEAVRLHSSYFWRKTCQKSSNFTEGWTVTPVS